MHTLGIDLGGSHITTLLLGADNGVSARLSKPIRDRTFEIVIEEIIRMSKEVAATTSSLSAVGFSVPGNVDPLRGTTRYLPSFDWPPGTPVREILSSALGIPVHLRNDGRCAALAEYQLGVGRGASVFAMMTLGTGIGGAFIVGGNLIDGSSFDAGDFGHHVIKSGGSGFVCLCGKRGCFEVQASAQGLVRHFGAHGGHAANAAEIMNSFRQNDTKAIMAFDDFLQDLATGIANLITFYNPDVVAIGGGLSQAHEIFDRIQPLVDARCLPATAGRAVIVRSEVGPDAGAIGAALLARTKS